MLEIALWICVSIAGLILLDLVLLGMEAKGWIYWRKTKRRPGGAGDILTGFNFTDPGTRYLEEARQEHVLEDEDDGDDDGQRKKSGELT